MGFRGPVGALWIALTDLEEPRRGRQEEYHRRMADSFRIVAQWVVAFLLAASAGGLASATGNGLATAAVGTSVAALCALFVGASMTASEIFGDMNALAGPGLYRATLIGFVGAGLAAGGLSHPAVGVITGLGGVMVLLATDRNRPPDG